MSEEHTSAKYTAVTEAGTKSASCANQRDLVAASLRLHPPVTDATKH
jgi:hypothetical protein